MGYPRLRLKLLIRIYEAHFHYMLLVSSLTLQTVVAAVHRNHFHPFYLFHILSKCLVIRCSTILLRGLSSESCSLLFFFPVYKDLGDPGISSSSVEPINPSASFRVETRSKLV